MTEDEFTAYHDLAGETGDQRWAFGTGFTDPLEGIDTSVPDGVDAAALAAYCLMLGDDALIYSHRLQQWMARLPELEEETAVANIALDLLGQARMLLARAGRAEGAVLAESWSETKARADALQHQLDGGRGCPGMASFSLGSERPTSLAPRCVPSTPGGIRFLPASDHSGIDRDRADRSRVGRENLDEHRALDIPLLCVECGHGIARDGGASISRIADFTACPIGDVWNVPFIPDILPQGSHGRLLARFGESGYGWNVGCGTIFAAGCRTIGLPIRTSCQVANTIRNRP